MLDTTRTTGDLQALDGAHHVHSFTDPAVITGGKTRVVVRGEGCQIWDSDGRRFLDGMAGLWCVNVGYGRQELVDAAARQMTELPFYSNHFQSTTPAMTELAHKLSQLTPDGLDHFLFTSSGSEANDTIVRIVRYFWKLQGKPAKRTFISRTMAYHGSTLAAASLCGMPHMHAMDGGTLPGFAHIQHPHWYMFGGELTKEEFGLQAAQALEQKILELGPDNVAAFIGEPVQGAGGVIDPPSTYWPEIQRICRKYDVLLVADEVIGGFGRTGEWFAHQHFGFEPDLITMAKGLTSGYIPMGAVGLHDRIAKAIIENGEFNHGLTYSGHPVAAAVAVANLRLLRDEKIVERVKNETGPYFQQSLRETFANHPIVGEIAGAGLVAGIQLAQNPKTRKRFENGGDVGTICRDFCFNGNLIMRATGDRMLLSPPLVVTKNEIDEIVAKAKKAIDATAQQLGLS
jgi:putrescine aminotransferase